MCTVIIQVPETAEHSIRMLAVRDEEASRPWDPPGLWWPDLPGVIGVRDRRAGGAWLATRAGRIAVLLNRAEAENPTIPASSRQASRGTLVLDDVTGIAVPDAPLTGSFNLVSVADGTATVTSWDGTDLTHTTLAPGVHMIAHHDVDDPRTVRVETWLPEFQKLAGAGDDWRDEWLELLSITTALPVYDDRAIIRDNEAHGYPTASLLVCTAEVAATVHLESATLARPAVWGEPKFVPAPTA